MTDNKTLYPTRIKAEQARKAGERILFDQNANGYFIKKSPVWYER